jgi:hypothetical protein
MTRRGLSFRVSGHSSPHDRAVAGSTALHSQYSKGNETSAQISAQEANLAHANEARLTYTGVTNISKVTKVERIHHGAIKLPKSGYYKTSTSRGRAYGMRFQDGAYLAGLRPLPRGDRFVAYDAVKAPRAATVTGRFPKFVKEIGVNHFDTRTSWSKAHKSSGFVKEVMPRKKRLAHEKNWMHRGHMWVPK